MDSFGAFEVMQFEDLRQSDEWGEYITRLGWRVINPKSQIPNPKIYVRKLPLIGSVVKIQRPMIVPPIEEIDKIAKKHQAFFVKLEPSLQPQRRIKDAQLHMVDAIGKHFEEDSWTLLPTRTIHLDLTSSEEEVFVRFSKDARYSIRRARRNGVASSHFIVHSSQPLREFYNLLKRTGKRKRFYVAPFKHLQAKVGAFKNKSSLILAYHNKEVIAGALLLFHDSVAYYHHAASSSQGREFLAAYLIVWEAIKLAKKRGCHTFDLEGIYDRRYKVCRRLKALSIFKRKFGGEEITFPGSFVRYYNPIIKLAFRVTAKIS